MLMHGFNIVRVNGAPKCSDPKCRMVASVWIQNDTSQRWCEAHWLGWDMKLMGFTNHQINRAVQAMLDVEKCPLNIDDQIEKENNPRKLKELREKRHRRDNGEKTIRYYAKLMRSHEEEETTA